MTYINLPLCDARWRWANFSKEKCIVMQHPWNFLLPNPIPPPPQVFAKPGRVIPIVSQWGIPNRIPKA